jgi:hypothetical protein
MVETVNGSLGPAEGRLSAAATRVIRFGHDSSDGSLPISAKPDTPPETDAKNDRRIVVLD